MLPHHASARIHRWWVLTLTAFALVVAAPLPFRSCFDPLRETPPGYINRIRSCDNLMYLQPPCATGLTPDATTVCNTFPTSLYLSTTSTASESTHFATYSIVVKYLGVHTSREDTF